MLLHEVIFWCNGKDDDDDDDDNNDDDDVDNGSNDDNDTDNNFIPKNLGLFPSRVLEKN